MTLLVLLVQDVPLGFYLERVEHERITTALERDAFVIAGQSEEALESESAEDDAVMTGVVAEYNDISGARVIVVNSEGVVVADSQEANSDVGTLYTSRPEIEQALAGTISTGERFSNTLNQELVYVAVPVFSGLDVIGAVRITFPEAVITAAVNQQIWLLALFALASLVVAGIIGYLVARSISRRISDLDKATRTFAQGDLSSRANAQVGGKELRSLASSFNDMAEKIDLLINQQKTFAADASHQLRTPLTALRLRLERAHELVTEDPEAAQARIEAAEEEVDRLGRLIEGLLLLSRTEASQVGTEVQDLTDIVQQRIESWEPLAREQQVSLTFTGDPGARVLAIPGAIEQVVDNFIDNALSHSPAHSSVDVSLTKRGDYWEVHVLDSGPGLSPDERSRAFDRFWRGKSDKSGSGLGLAIVKQLMVASNGKASLAARDPNGLDACASFTSAPS